MAYYLPRSFGCFGAGCSDLYPDEEAPSSLPAMMPPISIAPPSVDVSVQQGAPEPYIEPHRGLPWWLWLLIGFAVARLAKKEG